MKPNIFPILTLALLLCLACRPRDDAGQPPPAVRDLATTIAESTPGPDTAIRLTPSSTPSNPDAVHYAALDEFVQRGCDLARVDLKAIEAYRAGDSEAGRDYHRLHYVQLTEFTAALDADANGDRIHQRAYDGYAYEHVRTLIAEYLMALGRYLVEMADLAKRTAYYESLHALHDACPTQVGDGS